MYRSNRTDYFNSICEFKFLESKRLGRGSFGQVKLAVHLQSSKIYAVKIVEPKEITTVVGIKALQRETEIHSKIDHPHIIKLWQVFKQDSKVYMIMEYAEKGNLFYYQNQKRIFSQEQASVFFSQTLSAIQYLHALNYVHRDLKPENLLLDKDLNIKICDFGWVVEGINQNHNTFCGTYEYMAPQMIFQRQYDHKIDIWALGVLLYELLHGFAPFEGQTVQQVRESMLQGEIRIDPQLSNNVQNLIFNILKVDPNERISLQHIKSHPWMVEMKKRKLTTLQIYLNDTKQQQSRRIADETIIKMRNQSKNLGSIQRKVEAQKMEKGHSSKTLLVVKSKKKSNPHIKTNISADHQGIITLSKQKAKEKCKQKQKQNILKSINSSKKLIGNHKSQNSDFSQILKHPRLKTQIGNSKNNKYDIIRFNTEVGEGFQPIQQRSTIKKKSAIAKKACMYAANFLKTSQKPKFIRKSID